MLWVKIPSRVPDKGASVVILRVKGAIEKGDSTGVPIWKIRVQILTLPMTQLCDLPPHHPFEKFREPPHKMGL